MLRRLWPVATLLSLVGLVLLAAVAVWVYGVYSMSTPVSPSLMGMRVEGEDVTVKVAQCPQERVRRVEVRDSVSEKLVWQADGPRTEESRSGVLSLWKADEYDKPGLGRQPAELPEQLDILVDYNSDSGTGAVFDTAAVKSAQIPEGSYWTPDGVRTAKQIDSLVDCESRKAATL